MAKYLLAGIAACCALPLAVVLFIAALGQRGEAAEDHGLAGRPTQAAKRDIPPRFLAWYTDAAQTCPGLPWGVLAAVGKVESDHNRDATAHRPNAAGARGPMQFLPGTFHHYAVDGDHDGRTDIDTPADAIFTAARYLCSTGARDGREQGIRQALFAYNHAGWYVDRVLHQATRYATQTTHGAATTAIAWAKKQLGTPYVFGGDCTQATRTATRHNCDCSSLVQQAYAHAGIHLPRTTYQWNHTGPTVPISTIKPGDLLFSAGSDGTPDHPGHVVMYLGHGRVIQAPHTGDVVKISPLHRGSVVAATRPTARTT